MGLRGFEEPFVDDELVVLGEDGAGEIETVQRGHDVDAIALAKRLLRLRVEVRHRDVGIDGSADFAIGDVFPFT